MAILVVGLLQLLGVGSIVPLLGLVSDPTSSENQDVVKFVRDLYDFSSTDALVIFFASAAFGIIVLSNVLTATTNWFMFRFVWSIQSRLSTEILARYMAHPYEVLLTKNPAEAEKNILVEVHLFTNGVLLPLLRLVASSVIVLLLAGFLIVFNPILAVIATGVLGIGYFVSFLVVRRKLTIAGERRVEANRDRFRAVNEAIGGVKEAQVLGRTSEFVNRYQVPAYRYARTTSLQQILADMPRYAIEIIAFGSVMLAALYVAVSSGNLQEVAPVIGVYVVAGYRLMPAMQKMYTGWSQIRFNKAVIRGLHQAHIEGSLVTLSTPEGAPSDRKFESILNLSNVEYHYPESDEPVVKGLDLEIKRGQTVSFIGETGSGKTTVAELLIGVLRPTAGSILVDGVELTDQNMRNWHDQIGYVPQEIYLIDDTISANIAFGVPENEIDMKAVRWAAAVANIDDFVMNETEKKYDTVVGDRGVRLSGGQRQRIGIARALYQQPSVLFLDEATSNLDQETEFTLQEALEESLSDMTVILVAHRLNTTRSSDIIYVIDDGRVVGSGKYDEIVNADGTLKEEFSHQRN